jgi:hypothetical protein
MVEFFGGAPALFVPDNLRSGVTTPCRYEPVINRTYLDYVVAVLMLRCRRCCRESALRGGVDLT